MAGLAHIAGIDVSRTLATGAGAVVTGGTDLAGGAVIKHRHQPVGGDMAAIAGQCGGNMIDALASGNDRVMATLTAADGLGMIHGNQRQPGCIGMAGLTHIRSINVCGIFTRGMGAVMAGDAGIGNTSVIKFNFGPTCC